jgi:hypothetical protein
MKRGLGKYGLQKDHIKNSNLWLTMEYRFN